MIVPDSAVPWIKLHRTAALGDTKSAYARLIREDYDELDKWLPARCGSVLDIGCGLAGIDAYLYERYGAPALNLLDGTGQVEDVGQRINYHDEGMRPFNDMLAARELLTANGVDPKDIHEWPVGHSGDAIPCDLCVSLLSWGWHYPVGAYLDLAWWSVAEGGRLILDVRSGQGGEDALEGRGFKRLGVVRQTNKGARLCWERPATDGAKGFQSSVFGEE